MPNPALDAAFQQQWDEQPESRVNLLSLRISLLRERLTRLKHAESIGCRTDYKNDVVTCRVCRAKGPISVGPRHKPTCDFVLPCVTFRGDHSWQLEADSVRDGIGSGWDLHYACVIEGCGESAFLLYTEREKWEADQIIVSGIPTLYNRHRRD